MQHQVIQDAWIEMPDGVKLAARIWMPKRAARTPVPAILEFLPYRRRDGTSVRDESTYPTFADAGFAGVRVDLRGHGDSEGVMDDEYSATELQDACDLIAWIARQPWCNGKVGMMGISWGGFNALQTAFLRPPALKAVIALSTTVDRFADDIHYKGGALLSANISWASTMLCYGARAPDPLIVGKRWKKIWKERIANMPMPLTPWLSHQTRDEYWQRGSINQDWQAITAACLLIGGWADGYHNAPPTAVAHQQAVSKAINGPWIHKYPHFAWPRPRVDFLSMALAWWGQWLRDEPNQQEQLPDYRAYISEAVRPQLWRDTEPGRWVNVQHWPPSKPQWLDYWLGADGVLQPQLPQVSQPANSSAILDSPWACGQAAGEYFNLKPDAELSADQRIDDAHSLCFETAPLVTDMDILGRPRLRVTVRSNQPVAHLIARLVDVHPDGTAHRVSIGVLNLASRQGAEQHVAMPVGEDVAVEVLLDECGYRFVAGHRLRLALSNVYFPYLIPPPARTPLQLELGNSAQLRLPKLGKHLPATMPEPANLNPLPQYKMLAAAQSRRWCEHDQSTGEISHHIFEDTGVSENPVHGMLVQEIRRETWRISNTGAVSGKLKQTAIRERQSTAKGAEKFSARTETSIAFQAHADHFAITARVTIYAGKQRLSQRSWKQKIARTML